MIRRGNGNWRQTSKFHYLSDEEITQAIEIGSELQRACQLGSDNRLAVLRIDSGSPLHTEEGISKLLAAFGDIAGSAYPVQFADDWYFYFYFEETIQLEAANSWILNCLEAGGIGDGVHMYRPGDCVPLPLQPGFAWLNHQGQIIVRREEISIESALSLLLHDLNKRALSCDTLLVICQTLPEVQSEDLELQLCCEAPEVIDSELPEENYPTLPDKQGLSVLAVETPQPDTKDIPGGFLQLAIPMDIKPTVSEEKSSRAPPRNIRNYVSRRKASTVDERSANGDL